MKRLRSIFAVSSMLCLLLPGAVLAEDAEASAEEADDSFYGIDFSGGVAFATDYLFRGISQTSGNPALSGNVDLERNWGGDDSSIGIYAGMWASTLNFGDGDQGYLEWDFYGGLQGELFGISGTAGVLFYWYPSATSTLNYDFVEIPFTLGYTFFDLLDVGAFYYYSPDYFAASGNAHYVGGSVSSTPFPEALFTPTLDFSYGYQAIEDNAAFGTPDYHEWSLGLTLDVLGFDVAGRYHQTSLSDGQCFGGSDICGVTGTFTLGRSF